MRLALCEKRWQRCALNSVLLLMLCTLPFVVKIKGMIDENNASLVLWAMGDAHVGTDLKNGRRSLAEALEQSEQGGDEGGSPFRWDVAVNVGDYSGGQSVPEDEEGEEVIRQFSVLKNHRREQVYSVCGNHDRSALDEEDCWWFQKWIDPLGEHTAFSGVNNERRPYAIEQGSHWQHYSFRIGNMLFLMMSDRNEPTQKIGRGTLGGNPGGCLSGDTLQWWKQQVEANPDCIITSIHHYVLKDTTVASGDWEGMRKDGDNNWQQHYHGYYPEGTPRGASYLYWVDSQPDSGIIEKYFSEHSRNPASDIWMGGHTHTHPDDTYGGKSHIETRWGTHFLNVASLTRYHGKTSVPMSRVLYFQEGSPEVRVRCYMHTSEFKPQGWYDEAERTLTLSRPFRQER